MITIPRLVIFTVAALFFARAGLAHSDENLAMNDPDKMAWTLFLEVNADAKTQENNNALFETWASDGDTFQPTPTWPVTANPLALKPRALSLTELRAHSAGGSAVEVVPGNKTGKNPAEETRRNRPAFDFIVANNLYKVSGLKAAYAANKKLSFPVDSIEVKANWVEVSELHEFNGFTGTLADAQELYHVNSVGDKHYALVAMHVISKVVPNWTWATFEHKDNPGRCDVFGCKDNFGAQPAAVAPISAVESKQHYPDCAKTPELTALFQQAKIDPAFTNYCLKGSQADFTDDTGLAIRLSNSVTEKGFVAQGSCMTCHGRAAFDDTGKMSSFAGFDSVSINLPGSGNAQVGPINPNWFWVPQNPPSMPMLAGDKNIVRIAQASDFVWSIPFCAIDDTANPPQTTSKFCSGK
ncbi:hypothetical protein [Serratia silvae]|uniref:Cytochrome c domain-containing protein n=1 Tax=Serratia silvae TaxID=2824122 RepID=A0ABT0K7W6_9GAMM|nr:hypothetical protein [Serratia silvae]MCL1028143.1 hypothetical protein [Serratia silvae]